MEKLIKLCVQILTDNELLTDIMALAMLLIGLLVFVALLFINAPYGRYGSEKFGPLVNAKLAWFVQEVPAFLLPLCILVMKSSTSHVNKVLLLFFVAHYAQRSLIFPFLIKGGKPTPFVLFILAFIFCMYNGFMQANFLLNVASYPKTWLHNPITITGQAMYIFGMIINIHSDNILRNLRKPGETGYKIPKGGMFEFVSGANYFGEIVEWTGFAVMSQSFPAISFAIFTFCNLAPRAIAHHKWYKQKFEDYPKSRKAILPFLL